MTAAACAPSNATAAAAPARPPARLSAVKAASQRALDKYNILDAPRDAVYDDLCSLAADACGTKMAGVTMLDWRGKRQFWMASVGLPEGASRNLELTDEAAEAALICCQAVKLPPGEVFLVPCAREEARWDANPCVRALNLALVAATALVTPEGHRIGTLVVMDPEAKQLTEQAQESLRRLSRAVVRTLELRAALAAAEQLRAAAVSSALATARARDDLVSLISHEVRTPLQAVSGAVALLSSCMAAAGSAAPDTSLAPQELLEMLEEGSAQLSRVITDILEYDALLQARTVDAADAEEGEAAASTPAPLVALDGEVLTPALALAGLPPAACARLLRRGVCLRRVVCDGVPARLPGNAAALRRIVGSLVANAVKYAPDDGAGVVTLTVDRCESASAALGLAEEAAATSGSAPTKSASTLSDAMSESLHSYESEQEAHARPATPDSSAAALAALELRAVAPGPRLRIRVADNGVGIAAARLATVFTPLATAADGARHEHGGAGLGLAICRMLACDMGATLTAQSPGVGCGAVFTLTLPLPPDGPTEQACLPCEEATLPPPRVLRPPPTLPYAPPIAAAPQHEDAAAHSPRVSSSSTGASAWLRPDGSPLRVLLAEDNALCAAVVMRLLARTGAVVTAVADGAQAVQRCLEPDADYDLVVLDLEMPILNGLDAAEQIGRLSRPPPPPTVALSANSTAAMRQRCHRAGMVGYLSKPLRAEHLDLLRQHAKC